MTSILNITHSTGKLAHCHLILFKFEFNVLYHADIKHQAADTYLRLRTTGEDETLIASDFTVLCITVSTLRKRNGEVFVYAG